METTPQHFRLITGFAVQRDDLVVKRAFAAPQLFNDAYFVVADDSHADELEEQRQHDEDC